MNNYTKPICPKCGSDDVDLDPDPTGYDEDIDYYECQSCGYGWRE